MKRRVLICLCPVLLCATYATRSNGQTVFNAVSGGANGLFEVNNGSVTQIPTGLPTNDFPALSLDGRFISISAPDPAQPAQPSTDLFVWDRVTQNRRQVVNFTTQTFPDGSNATSNPSYSAISPSNTLVALVVNLLITTNLQGVSSTPRVTMHRFSDGFQTDLVEIGLGNSIDFFRSEYTGISWAADGSFFATPAYVNTLTATGQQRTTVGIVGFSFDSGSQKWTRSGQFTQPRIFDNVFPSVIETHVFPAVSPTAPRLGYFLLTWPDALLQQPVQATLMVQNLDGSDRQALVSFNPGFYPQGLTWSMDGSHLIYSIANQATAGGSFIAAGQPTTAVIRAVNANGGSPIQLAGVNSGFFPNQPRFAPPVLDLSQVELELNTAAGGGFVLTANGLNPNATYRLESSTDLKIFGNGQNFSGQEILSGISINRNASARFFRLARP